MAETRDTSSESSSSPSRQPAAQREPDPLGVALSEALKQVVAALRHHGGKQVGVLAKKGREKLDLYQARRDLDRLYQKLGREVVLLVEAGELQHPALEQRAQRIRKQEAELRAAEAEAPGAVDSPVQDPGSSLNSKEP